MANRSDQFSAIRAVGQGWEFMAAGQYDLARERFESAARIDPTDEEARDGLLESLKANSSLYRMLLKFGVRTVEAYGSAARFSPFMLAAAFSVAVGLFRKVIESNPAAAPILWPIAGGGGLVLMLLLQYADYASTLRVWFSEYRDLAMSKWELLISASGLLCIAFSFIFLLVLVVDRHFGYVLGSIFAFALTGVVDKVGSSKPHTPRVLMYVYFLVTAAIGLAGIIVLRVTADGTSMDEKIPVTAAWLCVVFLQLVAFPGVVAKPIGILKTKEKFIDNSVGATRLAGLTLSDRKLRAFHPECYGLMGMFHKWRFPNRGLSAGEIRQFMRERLQFGDAQPAVVLSTTPLMIAAYTEDMDCVALLKFDEHLIAEFKLKRGSKLLAVNSYAPDPYGNEDIVIGEKARRGWKNFAPLIAEFMSDDAVKISDLKRDIPTDTWARAARMGVARMNDDRHPPREGSPLNAHISHVSRNS